MPATADFDGKIGAQMLQEQPEFNVNMTEISGCESAANRNLTCK
jgi:hypothetical protein